MLAVRLLQGEAGRDVFSHAKFRSSHQALLGHPWTGDRMDASGLVLNKGSFDGAPPRLFSNILLCCAYRQTTVRPLLALPWNPCLTRPQSCTCRLLYVD